jgi:hypothetical protein
MLLFIHMMPEMRVKMSTFVCEFPEREGATV